MHAAGLDLIRWSMESMFGAVVNMEEDFDDGPDDDDVKIKPIPEEDEEDEYDPEKGILITPPPASNGDKGEKGGLGGKMFRVMDAVTVRCRRGYVELEWEGNILNDGIADAVLAILLNLESSPAAVKRKPSLYSSP